MRLRRVSGVPHSSSASRMIRTGEPTLAVTVDSGSQRRILNFVLRTEGPISLLSVCIWQENMRQFGERSPDLSFLRERTCSSRVVQSLDTPLQPSSQSYFFQCPPLQSVRIRPDTLQHSPSRKYFVGSPSGCLLSIEANGLNKRWKDSIFSSILYTLCQPPYFPAFRKYENVPHKGASCEFECLIKTLISCAMVNNTYQSRNKIINDKLFTIYGPLECYVGLISRDAESAKRGGRSEYILIV